MKLSTKVVAVALFVLSGPSVASAQTKSKTPPPPPLTGALKTQTKSMGTIPPPPPISSIKVPKKKRMFTASNFSALKHIPGREESGRADLLGKPVPFYPVTKGVDQIKPNMQQSASKTEHKRGTTNTNPLPTKPETYK